MRQFCFLGDAEGIFPMADGKENRGERGGEGCDASSATATQGRRAGERKGDERLEEEERLVE